MTNNIRKIKQDLRAYAKRCKDVHYTESLVITFLITGMLFATSNLFSAPTNTSIENQRQTISTSIKTIHQQVKATRKENDKLLKNTNLELIQLMEQGDHVVKSPWSSWQYGINYFNNNWNGTYKGRGDKKAKYPYEGILERDTNEFNRYMPTNSENYGLLGKSRGARSAATNARQGLPIGYGIASNIPVPEPPVSTIVNAGINPRNINKSPLNLTPKVANSPTLPEPVRFSPIDPNIVPPDDPALPVPPTFAVVLGADCNWDCNSHGMQRQRTKNGFLPNALSSQNTTAWLHYTWKNNNGAEKSYAFKMYAEENTSDITNPQGGSEAAANTVPSGNEYDFNSYNFGGTNEFASGVENSQEGASGDKNHQYFFIGGSRFWEIDNEGSQVVREFPSGKTLNLGGILTLGLVSQQNAVTLRNSGTITDIKEKNDAYIQNISQKYNTNVTFKSDGSVDTETTVPAGTGQYLKIKGPTSDYYIKKSTDGYVGYKIGIAQVYENGDGYNQKFQVLENAGKIRFYGNRSIGMYVYIPNNKSYAIMENKAGAEITLSGEESYGMKFASKAEPRAEMKNSGTINLIKNPNGSDKADNSAAMALMEDTSVLNKVSLGTGKAVNKGTINLTNVQNSSGAFINIDSDITNDTTGNINISSAIAKTSTNQPVNVAMRADKGTGNGGTNQATVINKGTISLDGSFAIGMLANGAKLNNSGTITTTANKTISNGIGVAGVNGANIENTGTIKLAGTGDTNNIGVYLKGSTGTVGTGGTPSVDVSGNNSVGVFTVDNKGTISTLTMRGNVKVSGNGISGIVAKGGSQVTLNGTADVTVDNNGSVSSPVGTRGSYGVVVKDSTSKFEGNDTTVNAKITNPESIGLYSGGSLTVNKTNITAANGALNFYADNGKIEIRNGGTTETGQKSLLFYAKGANANIRLSGGTLNATIKGGSTPSTRGTAFYYEGTGNTFNKTAIENYFKTVFGDGAGNSTLGHLNLNMEAGSRLFVASNVKMDLTNTAASTLTTGLTGGPNISGSSYKTFMLYLSELTVDNTVNLDNATDPYNELEIANSSIINKNTMSGSKNRQVAMAQENGNDTSGNGYEASKVKLVNETSGVINLTGEETTGIYAKRGIVENKGNISVGKKSTAIYVVEDDRGPTGRQSTTASNEAGGIIKLGENSTGIYYKVDSAGANTNEAGGIINAGTIESSSNDVIAMSYDNPHSNSRVFKNESTGLIDLKGQKSTAMYATGGGTYSVTNDGTIKLANSDNANSPNIGMYTDKSQITFNNDGTIEGGNKTVGIYGYGVNLGNTSTVKAGEGATGVYSKGGNVNIGTE